LNFSSLFAVSVGLDDASSHYTGCFIVMKAGKETSNDDHKEKTSRATLPLEVLHFKGDGGEGRGG
jgi:hypothetical protein